MNGADPWAFISASFRLTKNLDSYGSERYWRMMGANNGLPFLHACGLNVSFQASKLLCIAGMFISCTIGRVAYKVTCSPLESKVPRVWLACILCEAFSANSAITQPSFTVVDWSLTATN